jgi:mono/diheme cytochrome c family protein/predicted house-cleaning noncanonical NTP pyrophosphatase (MazG superfamily)
MKGHSLIASCCAAAFPLTALAAEEKVPTPAGGIDPAPSSRFESAQVGQIPQGENHLDGFDADLMHYTHQGSGFFPMSVVRSLTDSKTGKPYLENLERFGLVPGEKSNRNPEGFPIGIATNVIQAGGRRIEMFGFTCAACHTSDLRFKGKTVRVDGGSGLFYVDQLGDQIANSLKATLEDPEELLAFLQRFVRNSELGGPLRGGIEKLAGMKKGLVRSAAVRELHEEVGKLLAEIKEGKKAANADAASAKASGPKLFRKLREKLADHLEQEKSELLADILPHLKPIIAELQERIAFLKIRDWLSADPAHRLAAGYGRADDFGTARVELYGADNPLNMLPVNAPVSTPPLWNIARYAWLHWNANTNSVIQRSIGEAIGVGATLDSVNIVNQMHIEEQVHKLTAPVWPEFFGKPDQAKVVRGRELYNQHCSGCHSPKKLDEKGLVVFRLFTPDQVGTDPNDAKNFDRPVYRKDGSAVSFAKSIQLLLTDLQTKAKEAMTSEERTLMDQLEAKQIPVKWRDTMTETGGPVYPAKPLEGIWATAPFLHNGSVPTLYHLLRPSERPEKFLVGQKDFDPVRVGFEIRPDKITRDPGLEPFEFNTSVKGNLNTGHEYGAELSDEDCEALIEYLKVHRDTWPTTHAAYLKEHQSDFDWFANASNGYGGVPLILLRSLPDLAPEIWGKPEAQFARFGFIGNPNGSLPLGLSWDSMDPAHPPQPLHPVALTCGACHIGRVRLEDGAYQEIVGGPNTQFDVRMWRKAFETTVHQLLSSPEDITKTADRLSKVIGDKPPNYYFHNSRGVTDQAEAGERQVVAAKAADILSGFAAKILLGELATSKQKATSYSKANAPPLDGGSPGQSDGSGDLLPRLVLLDSVLSLGPTETIKTFLTSPSAALPNQLATVTDILSTWQLGTRNIAQIDGSVKSNFFRNVAASLAVAGDPKMVNVVNADITARFISQLPAPAYPFGIDEERAHRGGELFHAHCAACHKQFNDIIYKTDFIGTDRNRSRVLNPDGLALFLKHFVASVPDTYETTDAYGAKYKPHDLPAASILFDRSLPENQGYVTNALEGLWARAPYLHNGAVPTLYHLLVPAERPAKFVRGSISYDPEKIGFVSDLTKIETYRAVDPTVAVYDTSWDSASNLGHDTNLTIAFDGRILRKGWDGQLKDGEVRVRLDWGGAENKDSLFDLLEYLKTL